MLQQQPMNQEIGTSKNKLGIIAGKAILVAGLVLLGYCAYAIASENLGYQICPQFRQSVVVIGWCGNPSMYIGYVVSSTVSIALGSFLYLMSAKETHPSSRAKVAIEVLFVLVAFFLLAGSVLLILYNFHTDFYG